MAWPTGPCFEVKESTSPQTREALTGSKMRHGLRPGAGSGSPDDCLVPTYPESSPNYYDTTTENLRRYFSYFSATTKSNKTRSLHNKTPPHHHAAMTRRSSLRAAVEPIPAVGRHRSVNNRTGLADTGSGDHLVTHRTKRKHSQTHLFGAVRRH